MCGFARQGLPIGRAASLAGCHRASAMRWMSLGAAEIAEAGDDADELGPRAAFALDFEAARAEYLLGLATEWEAAIKRKDANTAKVIAGMLSSQSPDEYSERRAVRSVDQRTTLAGEISVSRFDSMSTDDLNREREKIMARRDAAQAGAGSDSWQAAVAMPRQGTDEDRPEPAVGENNSTPEKSKRSLSTRKPQVGGVSVDDLDVSQKNTATRARSSDVSVEAVQSDVQTDGPAPGHAGEGGGFAGPSPSPPLPASADDEETKL